MRQVIVVDDDIRMARIVEGALRKNYRVTICTSGVDALETISREPPDLAILDVAMPGLTGLEICRRLRQRFQPTQLPVLFLSAKGMTEDKIAGFEAGADDYLAKPFDIRELELRVDALTRRNAAAERAETVSTSNELRVNNLRLDPKTFRAYVDQREVQLTPVEYELLRYLMLRAGEVISSEQLLQEVWRYYPGTGDAAVVRVQIMNLRDKIEKDRRRPAYIQTVYRHGYMVPA